MPQRGYFDRKVCTHNNGYVHKNNCNNAKKSNIHFSSIYKNTHSNCNGYLEPDREDRFWIKVEEDTHYHCKYCYHNPEFKKDNEKKKNPCPLIDNGRGEFTNGDTSVS